MVSQKRMLEVVLDVQRRVKEHGWVVMGIGAGQGEPSFCYTVGFTAMEHPEVIVFGLAFEIGQTLLNDMGSKIMDGRKYADGEIVDDLVVGYPVTFISVTDSRKLLTMANRLYGKPGKPIAAIQLILPDAEHHWPWDPDSKLTYPLLGDIPEL